MGFFDKLLWGASKRVANDVSRSVVKQSQNREKDRIVEKINFYNAVSQHYYERFNAVRNAFDLVNDILDNLFSEDKSNEKETELLNQLGDYYLTSIQPLSITPPTILTGNALTLYQEGLDYYEQSVQNVKAFLVRRTLIRLETDYHYGESTKEEYGEKFDNFFEKFEPFDTKDKRDLAKIQGAIITNLNEFSSCADRVLSTLK